MAVAADFQKKKKETVNCEAETQIAVGTLLTRSKGEIK